MHGSIQDYLWCDIIMNTVADLLAFLLSLTEIDYLCDAEVFLHTSSGPGHRLK